MGRSIHTRAGGTHTGSGYNPRMHLRRKLAWITVLYFAEGFPFGIAYDVWPVYFREHGVSLVEIGLMSLLFLPYTLKPAWAPLVDRLGSRQNWIATAELALAVLTAVITFLDPSHVGWHLWIVLLAFTVTSSTQDIAIDAFAVDVSTPRDSGAINGVRVSAYRVALVASGGVILVLADRIGWRGSWLLTSAVFALMALLSFLSPRVPRERPQRSSEPVGARVVRIRAISVTVAVALTLIAWGSGWSSVWITLAVITAALAVGTFFDASLLSWVFRREMVLVVIFILLYKVGDSTLGHMVKPFWVDNGLTATQIGIISSTLGMLLTIVGALAGGWFTTKFGIFRGLLWCGIAQAVSNFGYVAVAALPLGHNVLFHLPWLGAVTPLRGALYSASIFESFAQGLGTAAFLAFLMNLCDRRHAATQFALLTAVFALSRDVAGAFSGLGVQELGYAAFFAFTAVLALPALLMLPWLRDKIREEPVAADA